MIRVIIIFRAIFEDVFQMVHLRTMTPQDRRPGATGSRGGGRSRQFAAWRAIFVLAAIRVSIEAGLSASSSATAVAATLNVIGPGLRQVGASESYEAVSTFGRAVLTACMRLGRLEIFTTLVPLSSASWRKQEGFRFDAARKVLRRSAKVNITIGGSRYCKSGELC